MWRATKTKRIQSLAAAISRGSVSSTVFINNSASREREEKRNTLFVLLVRCHPQNICVWHSFRSVCCSNIVYWVYNIYICVNLTIMHTQNIIKTSFMMSYRFLCYKFFVCSSFAFSFEADTNEYSTVQYISPKKRDFVN